MIKTYKPIGISGVARSGKDTLARLLTEEFSKVGVKTKHLSFASQLKSDLDKFCKKMFGISAYTEDDAEKKIVRNMFVGYGQAKRMQSNCSYFINILIDKVEMVMQSGKLAIITDVRYAENDNDEAQKILKYFGGQIIFLNRTLSDGSEQAAANQTEEESLKKVKDIATHFVYWETESDIEQLRPYAKLIVEDYLATNFYSKCQTDKK